MSGVASWLNAAEMDLEREIDRLRAEVRALRALWRPTVPASLASRARSIEGEPSCRRSETER